MGVLQNAEFRAGIAGQEALPQWTKVEAPGRSRFETTLRGPWLAPELACHGITEVPLTVSISSDNRMTVRHDVQYSTEGSVHQAVNEEIEQALQRTVNRAVNHEIALTVLQQVQAVYLERVQSQRLQVQQMLSVQNMEGNRLQVQMNVYQRRGV